MWVVTAAHCVFYIPDATRYKVVLGKIIMHGVRGRFTFSWSKQRPRDQLEHLPDKDVSDQLTAVCVFEAKTRPY